VTSSVTGRDGTTSVEAPLGRVDVVVGPICEVAWVGVDLETVVEITC